MFNLTEQDLEDLWLTAWIKSKGFDKFDESNSDITYRDNSFKEYLNNLNRKLEEQQKEEVDMVKPNFVVYGDVINTSIEPEENQEVLESEEDTNDGKVN